MLKICGFSKVNAGARDHTRDLRVLWALEEMQLLFEVACMDHPAHDLNTDDYRQLSPVKQIPAVNDEGLMLAKSAAILDYLAKKSGRIRALCRIGIGVWLGLPGSGPSRRTARGWRRDRLSSSAGIDSTASPCSP